MNMLQKLIPLFLISMLSIGVASADDPSKATSADATFKSLDRDADERLSKTEVARDKMLTDHFASVDANSDGFVSKTEYTAHMRDMKKETPAKDY
jgi:hypothetical protein